MEFLLHILCNNIHWRLVLYVSSGYVVVAFKESYLQPACITRCSVRLTLDMLTNRETKIDKVLRVTGYPDFVHRLALRKERKVPSSIYYTAQGSSTIAKTFWT
jgi:hypothetical protein